MPKLTEYSPDDPHAIAVALRDGTLPLKRDDPYWDSRPNRSSFTSAVTVSRYVNRFSEDLVEVLLEKGLSLDIATHPAADAAVLNQVLLFAIKEDDYSMVRDVLAIGTRRRALILDEDMLQRLRETPSLQGDLGMDRMMPVKNIVEAHEEAIRGGSPPHDNALRAWINVVIHVPNRDRAGGLVTGHPRVSAAEIVRLHQDFPGGEVLTALGDKIDAAETGVLLQDPELRRLIFTEAKRLMDYDPFLLLLAWPSPSDFERVVSYCVDRQDASHILTKILHSDDGGARFQAMIPVLSEDVIMLMLSNWRPEVRQAAILGMSGPVPEDPAVDPETRPEARKRSPSRR